jgi:hypothetical protein
MCEEQPMDQSNGAGHHAITREAVRELFASGRADAGGRIDGMTEDEYYAALDEAQLYQDRWYGPTLHPASLDGAAQREHGMADPQHDGAWNLATDEQYVEDELTQAHGGHQMQHLGAAAHALEDSYSEAHAWRGPSADQGDPNAPVESFNVYDPMPDLRLHMWGAMGTHDERFDHVPLDEHGHLIHGTDQAAAHATAEMLEAYHDHEHQTGAQAAAAEHEAVHHFYQPGEPGVAVNDGYTPEWGAERDRRLAEHTREEHDYHQRGVDQCVADDCQTCAADHAVSNPCARPNGHLDAHECSYGHTWY